MPMTRPRPAKPPRPSTPWAWALLGGLTGGLLAGVLFAPAPWLASAVSSASGGQVQLRQARGSVWSGSAQLVLTGGYASQDQATLPGRIEWTLRPQWSGLQLLVHAPCCTPQAPLQVRVQPGWMRADIRVSDHHSLWPAQVLTGLGTPWNTIAPTGQLAISTHELSIGWAAGRATVHGQLQLDANNMASRLSTLRPMGSYQLHLRGGATPTLELSTTSGELQLSGSGQWVDGRLHFSGQATASPEREAALANLLNIIGRRTGARSIITVG